MSVLATASSYDSLITALTTAAQSAADAAMSAIGAVVPVALTVMGAGVVITVGIKIFKRVTSKS